MESNATLRVGVKYNRGTSEVLLTQSSIPMLTPSPENKNLHVSSVAEKFSSRVTDLATNFISAVIERCSQYLSARQKHHQHLEEMRLQQRATWSQAFTDKIFMLLDYDSTDIESGETSKPSLFGALHQWLVRTFWTRRIELGGFLFIAVIGLVCYLAIASSK